MLFPFMDDQPTTRWPIITLAIIALNVLTFLGVNNLQQEEVNRIQIHYGFVPARIPQLFGSQQPVRVVYSEDEQPVGFGKPNPVTRVEVLKPDPAQVLISLITAMFLHGGVMHIFGNMWFLWLYGNNVEDRLGHGLFLLFYLVGGIVATLSHAFFAQLVGGGALPMIGASGAVAAVLGGYAVTYPFARVRTVVIFFIITVIELPALAVLGFWFAAEVISGILQAGSADAAGVAFWAHVGGFVFGLAVMPILNRFVPPITPDLTHHEGFFTAGPPQPAPHDPRFGGPPGYPPARPRYGSFWPPPRPDPTGIHFPDDPPPRR